MPTARHGLVRGDLVTIKTNSGRNAPSPLPSVLGAGWAGVGKLASSRGEGGDRGVDQWWCEHQASKGGGGGLGRDPGGQARGRTTGGLAGRPAQRHPGDTSEIGAVDPEVGLRPRASIPVVGPRAPKKVRTVVERVLRVEKLEVSSLSTRGRASPEAASFLDLAGVNRLLGRNRF